MEKAAQDSAQRIEKMEKERNEIQEEHDAQVAKLRSDLSGSSAKSSEEITKLQKQVEDQMDSLSNLTLQVAAKDAELQKANEAAIATGETHMGKVRNLQEAQRRHNLSAIEWLGRPPQR